jgi:predicted dehydrogenase
MRIAIVGVDHPHGAGWRDLLFHFCSELEIVAIVPEFGGGLTSLEERFADLPRFESVERLTAWGQFDAAVVCLPNDVGPDAVTRLARAGKHVLAEKPIASCAADFQCVVEAVQQRNVVFQHGYMWRYDEAANRLRSMIGEGRFGKLINVEMTFVTSDVRHRGASHYLFDPQVSKAGFFNWLGCHFLDLLLHVTGQRVVGVTARTGVFGAQPVDVEDGGVVILELKEGAIVSFTGGYWLPRWTGQCRWCLRGSERWVDWDPARPGTGGVLEIHGPKPQWYAMEEVFSLPQDDTPGYGGRNGVALVRDWVEAIGGKENACRQALDSSLATLQLLDAIYLSSQRGERIACDIGP